MGKGTNLFHNYERFVRHRDALLGESTNADPSPVALVLVHPRSVPFFI
jgi:hypothetical protein